MILIKSQSLLSVGPQPAYPSRSQPVALGGAVACAPQWGPAIPTDLVHSHPPPTQNWRPISANLTDLFCHFVWGSRVGGGAVIGLPLLLVAHGHWVYTKSGIDPPPEVPTLCIPLHPLVPSRGSKMLVGQSVWRLRPSRPLPVHVLWVSPEQVYPAATGDNGIRRVFGSAAGRVRTQVNGILL